MDKNFWKHIKTLRKLKINPHLRLNNELITEKADALNNQFYSIFTDKNLSDIPESTDNKVSSTIPLITFSVEHQLNLLNTQKASGPDYILAFVLYHVLLKLP